jgi:hypothetical protein
MLVNLEANAVNSQLADLAIGGLGMYVVISLSAVENGVAGKDAHQNWEAGSKASAMLVLIMAYVFFLTRLSYEETASDTAAVSRISSQHLAVLLGVFLFGQGVEREPRALVD